MAVSIVEGTVVLSNVHDCFELRAVGVSVLHEDAFRQPEVSADVHLVTVKTLFVEPRARVGLYGNLAVSVFLSALCTGLIKILVVLFPPHGEVHLLGVEVPLVIKGITDLGILNEVTGREHSDRRPTMVHRVHTTLHMLEIKVGSLSAHVVEEGWVLHREGIAILLTNRVRLDVGELVQEDSIVDCHLLITREEVAITGISGYRNGKREHVEPAADTWIIIHVRHDLHTGDLVAVMLQRIGEGRHCLLVHKRLTTSKSNHDLVIGPKHLVDRVVIKWLLTPVHIFYITEVAVAIARSCVENNKDPNRDWGLQFANDEVERIGVEPWHVTSFRARNQNGCSWNDNSSDMGLQRTMTMERNDLSLQCLA